MDQERARVGDSAALSNLTRLAHEQLRALGEDTKNWVFEAPGTDVDVAIVGGAQTGVATAFALRRAGIHRIRVFDMARPGREGCWNTIARMKTLRSPKDSTGPELGIPALTFEAWYVARQGLEAYQSLDKIPTEIWSDYLRWFRTSTGVQVENETCVLAIEPVRDHLRLTIEWPAGHTHVTARKVVLATGMDACGGHAVPAAVRKLPRRYWTHSDAEIDLPSITRGRRVAVLGAASSAFDSAAVALEAGAAEVRLFARTQDLVRSNPVKGLSYAGVMDHFHELPDWARWRIMHYYHLTTIAGPTFETVRRATSHPNFLLHLSSPWLEVNLDRDEVVVRTSHGNFRFDYVIAGTGYEIDLGRRRELAQFADGIALWRDRYVPPPDLTNETLAGYPYLDPAFGFLEKRQGSAAFLRNLHCFNYAALISHGRSAGEVASLKWGVPKLVRAIGRDLLLADVDRHVEYLLNYAVKTDLTGEEYVNSVVAPRSWKSPVVLGQA